MSIGLMVLAALPESADWLGDLAKSPKARIYLALAIIGVSLIAVAIAILIAVKKSGRKSGRRRRHRHRSQSGSGGNSRREGEAAVETDEGVDELPRPGMRRKVSRQINPTLAQTGGLPPRRKDGELPPNLP